MVRYAALVKERGATVVLAKPANCAEILSRCAGIDAVCSGESETWPPFDVYASLASLPGVFQTSPETIPSEVPYLYADPHAVAMWREKLAAAEGLHVGIAWQTRAADRHQARPPLSLARFTPLADVPGIHFVTVQEGADAASLAEVQQQLPITVLEIAAGDDRGLLAGTAAVIANLDLVITPDLPLAHLAGALARVSG